jgi:CHAD domain-containing protein
MIMTKKQKMKVQSQTAQSQTLGNYAYQVIEEQFQHVSRQEKRVLADQDPEPLHQMRVSIRRLRTALQIFGPAIALPKAASPKRLRNFARVLGEVRDLDVQMASIQQDYLPHLSQSEQKLLNKAFKGLMGDREKAFAHMKAVITESIYPDLKVAYTSWLKDPQFHSIAQLSLAAALPDLVNPLLAALLLHPGWFISIEQVLGEQVSDANSVLLHDLRKACKHARYQAEFFTPFYGEVFQDWMREVKTLQAHLGDFQDTQVFLALLSKKLGRKMHLPELQAAIQQKQAQALSDWEPIRKKYQDQDFRYHLHEILSSPMVKLNAGAAEN